MAAAGLLFPGVGALPVTRTASCPPRPAATPSRVRLPAAAAAPARVVRCLRSASRPTACARLRCANTSTAGLDGVTEDDVAGLPSWAPSIEELIEYGNTDFSPEAIHERFVRESKEATAAVKGAVAGVFLRPLREFFQDVRKLESVYDVEEFQIGLPVGALMACVAVYHLWKAAPSAFVNFALHYAFYRLCVMAADVRRRGFATDLIIRLKLFITMAMLLKGMIDQVAFYDYVLRFALFSIYFFSVSWEVKGLKKYGRYMLPMLFDSLKTPQGRREWCDTISEIDFGIDEDD